MLFTAIYALTLVATADGPIGRTGMDEVPFGPVLLATGAEGAQYSACLLNSNPLSLHLYLATTAFLWYSISEGQSPPTPKPEQSLLLVVKLQSQPMPAAVSLPPS